MIVVEFVGDWSVGTLVDTAAIGVFIPSGSDSTILDTDSNDGILILVHGTGSIAYLSGVYGIVSLWALSDA